MLYRKKVCRNTYDGAMCMGETGVSVDREQHVRLGAGR